MKNQITQPGFQDTRWSIVRRIQEQPAATRLSALDELCRIYWPAIYSFARYKGLSSLDAEDHTQGFFAQLLYGEKFKNLDPAKGRLRSWLIRSFENYLKQQHRHATAVKRGGEWIRIEINTEAGEEQWDKLGISSDDTEPGQAMDRIWAMTLIQSARNVLERDYQKRNKGKLFTDLSRFLNFGDQSASYGEFAMRWEISEEAARKQVQRFRAEYAKGIRNEIAQTVESVEDIASEFEAFRIALS